MVRKVVLALLISASSTLFAQNTPSFELSVDSIMRGPQLVGYEPQSVRWSADNRKVYFSWKTYSDPIRKDFDTWVVNADGTGLRRLSKDEALHAPPSSGRETRDRKRIVFTRDGDVYLFDSAVGKSRQLTKTTDSESSARFTHDEKSVTFVRANNLFRISLSSGEIEQLTDIVAASDKSARVEMWNEKKETKSQEYLRAEERKLLKTIDERARKREEDEADAKRKNPRKPHKLDAGQEVADLELTPDGRFVLASFTTEADKAKSTMIPNFITETAYTTPINGRKKVGDALPVSKLASINVT